MKLWEYVIFLVPKKTDTAEKPKILVDKKMILAESANHVTLLAAREIPTDYLGRLDEVQVAVKSF